MLNMEGRALDWHYFHTQKHKSLQMLKWPEYAISLRELFGSSMFAKPIFELVTLKQQGLVEQYHDTLGFLASPNSISWYVSPTTTTITHRKLVSMPNNTVSANGLSATKGSSKGINPALMNERKQKGLCFWCSAKCQIGHNTHNFMDFKLVSKLSLPICQQE
ncbi:hypothetical protein PVK06_009949 [Gossypium arboreum]|uniref:Retrotransposon gag domain-containing protein n=1 Tax=Gossypium arboreum TaxID=29729 RepID=A0ABR0QPU2_GOSAR|nr:hypothetical protein PVK06_009949 [Gossypium arboreum]